MSNSLEHLKAMVRAAGRITPRGFSRVQSAGYIGVGATKFDEMVKDGRMPKPKRVDGRNIWDRYALDLAFEDLPNKDDGNPWDEDAA